MLTIFLNYLITVKINYKILKTSVGLLGFIFERKGETSIFVSSDLQKILKTILTVLHSVQCIRSVIFCN